MVCSELEWAPQYIYPEDDHHEGIMIEDRIKEVILPILKDPILDDDDQEDEDNDHVYN